MTPNEIPHFARNLATIAEVATDLKFEPEKVGLSSCGLCLCTKCRHECGSNVRLLWVGPGDEAASLSDRFLEGSLVAQKC